MCYTHFIVLDGIKQGLECVLSQLMWTKINHLIWLLACMMSTNHTVVCTYAGTVMMSFDHVIIPTCSNWFQTNPLEHESNDRAGNIVSFVCVTNGKGIALQ